MDDIFELIRKEEMILWIGSGFSRYTGLPLGVELTKLIYDQLTTDEKKQISPNLSLADVAEQFVRIKTDGKKKLIAVLEREFLKKPNSTKYHELLSSIPHIKTIMTTNYDTLLEDAYGRKSCVVVNDIDIPLIGNDKTEIIKVHGDFNSPHNIVLTKSDYENFTRKHVSDSLVWSLIKSRVAQNAVLFLGYDLEDGNVINLIDDINDILGANRKEIFLIAPRLKKHKIQYLQSKGIKYINTKGEIFVEKLLKNIKDKIFTDLSLKKVKTDTVNAFLANNNLQGDIEITDNRFRFTNLRGISNNVQGKLNFSFKDIDETKRKFDEFLTGENFEDFELGQDALTNFSLTLADINLLDTEPLDYKLILSNNPSLIGQIDLKSGSEELNNIHFELYSRHQIHQVKLRYLGSENIMRFELRESLSGNKGIDFKYFSSKNYTSTKSAIEWNLLMLEFSRGKKITIYSDKLVDGFNLYPNAQYDFEKGMETHLHFYRTLKLVEEEYDFRFRKIGHPDDIIYGLCKKALGYAKGKINTIKWDGKIDLDLDETFNLHEVVETLNGECDLQTLNKDEEILHIYEHKINIGIKNIIFPKVRIKNLADLDKKDLEVLSLVSDSRIMKVFYTSVDNILEGKG